jgi:hypothetical protein
VDLKNGSTDVPFLALCHSASLPLCLPATLPFLPLPLAESLPNLLPCR